MNVQVSEKFKSTASKAVVSIVLFMLVYFLLTLTAIVLTVAAVWGGIAMIIAKPSALTLGIGLGLAGFGFFILFFLFKFIFAKHTVDLSNLTEIKRADAPKLFTCIDEIVREVQTDFPKKVFLSSEVNASVFYDSSFWSMFFPVKKNLQIGVGLVNSVTETELKAILAHEFGHFSQQSMKVGSYVYNVNKVIYNMLYENDDFSEMLNGWSNMTGYFYIFGLIAVQIIKFIQWVLKKMYDVVNLNYMALSREMEFHADEVAANVAGSEPLKNALLRLDLANAAHQSVISFYNERVDKNLRSSNFFPEMRFVMRFLAKENKVPLRNDLPLITTEFLKKFNATRLMIKDQWASHPSEEERIAALDRLNIRKEQTSEKNAATLFENIEEIEKKLTDTMYQNVRFTLKPDFLSFDDFQKNYTEDFEKNSFPRIFNDYYDKHTIEIFAYDSEINIENESIETLFGNQRLDVLHEYNTVSNDYKVLMQIAHNEIKVKTFDYDGEKYKVKDALRLARDLNIRVDALKDELQAHDKKVYAFFRKNAAEIGRENEVFEAFEKYFGAVRHFHQNLAVYYTVATEWDKIKNETFFKKITDFFECFKKTENEFKDALRTLLNYEYPEDCIPPTMQANFDFCLKNELRFWDGKEYNQEHLSRFLDAVGDFVWLDKQMMFLAKKQLLDFLADLSTNFKEKN